MSATNRRIDTDLTETYKQLKPFVAVIETECAVISVIRTHHYKHQEQIEIFIRHTEANYAAVN